jgi:exodeoxyribonuclease-5
MNWSPQQDRALTDVARWLENSRGRPVFRLFGYAGTGKTTLANSFAHEFGGVVRFASFTGKAALVMRRKGCDGASTLHSLIYKTVERPDGTVEFVINRESELATAELLIIDEVSMVNEELGRDVLSFGVPVLVLGDPAQLPPVKGAGYFTTEKPDVMLTEIHRQAFDNPIVRMATTVREGGRLRLGEFSAQGSEHTSRVIKRADLTQRMVMSADQVLVGLNKTRMGTNGKMRSVLGRPADRPVEGDRLVCLRNNKDKGLLNGGLWEIEMAEITTDICDLMIKSLDDPADGGQVPVQVPLSFFITGDCDLPPRARRQFDEFTYGYALTVHKSQGSQWDDVLIMDESHSFGKAVANGSGDADTGDTFRQQWLYTAITRAAESVTIVQPDWYFK